MIDRGSISVGLGLSHDPEDLYINLSNNGPFLASYAPNGPTINVYGADPATKAAVWRALADRANEIAAHYETVDD